MRILITSIWGSNVRRPWPNQIKFVALCGNPKSGKSTVARMLEDEFGGVLVDDGLILRKAVPILFGIPEDEPFTQEGKVKVYDVCGREESVRQMLGELGNYLEERYSPDFMPTRSLAIARRDNAHAPFSIFGSCRREQGRCYKRNGGIVIEVDNPLAAPSGNIWDEWDRSCVDFRLHNDPRELSLDDLRDMVCALPDILEPLLT
jgi:hypothetical protein